jgi:hypothetical protein
VYAAHAPELIAAQTSTAIIFLIIILDPR